MRGRVEPAVLERAQRGAGRHVVRGVGEGEVGQELGAQRGDLGRREAGAQQAVEALRRGGRGRAVASCCRSAAAAAAAAAAAGDVLGGFCGGLAGEGSFGG